MPQFIASLIAAMIITLSGCAAKQLNLTDPSEIAAKIQVQRDTFKQTTMFEGPNCAPNPRETIILLRAWKPFNSDDLTYQLYLSDEYTYEIMRGGVGWRFYATTHDSEGIALPTTQISRAVNWCGRYVCSYREIVGATVTRPYLDAHKDQGITIKVSGKGGENIFVVPATYIQAFLTVAH